MGTAKFDDGLPSNPKFIRAGAVASWLWVCGVLYCRRGLTDGLIPRVVVPSLVVGLKSPYAHAKRLVEVGLWDVEADDYRVHDFLDWNPSKAQIEGYRAQDRERKQARHSDRNLNGIHADSKRIPVEKAVTRGTHARAESESVSESESGFGLNGEESARETDDAGRAIAESGAWGNTHQRRGGLVQPLATHARCFEAPSACARGWCIPRFLGERWVLQAGNGDYAAGLQEVSAFVLVVLESHLGGKIGDPLKFWESEWHARHGKVAPGPSARLSSAQHTLQSARTVLSAVEDAQRELEP